MARNFQHFCPVARALERIGFGPCYHMDEVFRRPDHVAMWGDASLREPDWRVLLDGCVSAADAPVCHFWRQIRDAYPDAKVVLTVRDSESWYESFHATVFQTMMHPTLVPAPARAPLEMARRLVLAGSSPDDSKTKLMPLPCTRLTIEQSPTRSDKAQGIDQRFT